MTAARLSLFQAALVIARRDFVAVLFSRAFFFFLLGPLFPVAVIATAGALGGSLAETGRPVIAIAMASPDREAFIAAHEAVVPRLGTSVTISPTVEIVGGACEGVRGSSQMRKPFCAPLSPCARHASRTCLSVRA